MQFLMGLNDTYDHVRNQILLMEPLPSLNRAYLMVLRVEKQKNVQVQFPDTYDNVAMSTKTTNFGMSHGGYQTMIMTTRRGKGTSGRGKEDKSKLLCEHCKGTGHKVNHCFKLHGYPNWYKRLRDQRNRPITNLTDTVPIHSSKDEENHNTPLCDMAAIIHQEITKYLGGIGKSDTEISFAHFAESVGKMPLDQYHYALTMFEEYGKDSWILDTGASGHMCTNLRLMSKHYSYLNHTFCLPP